MVGVTGSIPVVLPSNRVISSQVQIGRFVPGFALPVSGPFGLYGRMLSLAAMARPHSGKVLTVGFAAAAASCAMGERFPVKDRMTPKRSAPEQRAIGR